MTKDELIKIKEEVSELYVKGLSDYYLEGNFYDIIKNQIYSMYRIKNSAKIETLDVIAIIEKIFLDCILRMGASFLYDEIDIRFKFDCFNKLLDNDYSLISSHFKSRISKDVLENYVFLTLLPHITKINIEGKYSSGEYIFNNNSYKDIKT